MCVCVCAAKEKSQKLNRQETLLRTIEIRERA